MRIDGNVVLLSFIGFLLPKRSIQEKPEDCIPGEQYWGTDIHSTGTCISCPRYLDNCDGQGPDKDACKHSCSAKPTILPLEPATIPPTPTSSYIPPEHSNVLPNSSTPGPVIGRSTLRSDEPHQNPISLYINQNVWLIILLAVLSVLVILGLVAFVVLLVRRSKKPVEVHRDAEEGIALQPLPQNNHGDRVHELNEGEGRAHEANDGEVRARLPNDEHCQVQNNVEERVRQPHDEKDHSQSLRPPVQATPSDPWIGGIKEFENTRLSSLDVHGETHT